MSAGPLEWTVFWTVVAAALVADIALGRTATLRGCEECMKLGEQWVHLRMCLACGHVGCCDSSKNKHATKHFDATGHPVMRSLQPGENWRWCYVDRVMVD